MAKVRMGDIAMITPKGEKAVYAGEMAGKLVRVVRPTLLGEVREDPGGSWVIESLSGTLRVDRVDAATGEFVGSELRTYRHLSEEHLTPLRDSEEPDETLSWVNAQKGAKALGRVVD